MPTDSSHRTRTLWLCGILHAFTHLYHVVLLPLYFLIQKDLKLTSVDQATALVTVLMLAYFIPSYFVGIMADRYSRKKLLVIGLGINAIGFIILGLAQSYSLALFSMVLAGLGGSFYHPAATAMVARLFPERPGKALGLVGIGASAGFLLGPLYAGWRAELSSWRTPMLELGILGLVTAILFAWLADEVPQKINTEKVQFKPNQLFPRSALWILFLAASIAFSLRDFAGSSMGSLTALFLQQAWNYDAKSTGLALGGIFLAALVSNPLFGSLSDRGRAGWTTLVLVVASILVAVFPHVSPKWFLSVLVVYGFFFLASYPMVEATLMQAVPDSIRGRVFGVFITIGGLVGNVSHWVAGKFVQYLGDKSHDPASYHGIYALFAILIACSLVGVPCLRALGKKEAVLTPEPQASDHTNAA